MRTEAAPTDSVLDPRELLARVAAEQQELLGRARTPCLIVDGDALRTNCRTAETQARTSGVAIRPHAKAHKCSALLRLQLAGDNVSGVTCATAYEAQALASLGFDDILVANEIVSGPARDALAEAARLATKVTVAVDGPRGVKIAAAAARSAEREIGILVDVDVGSGRCGVAADGAAAWQLAQLAVTSTGVRFEGIMGYTGRANYAVARSERRAMAQSVKAKLELVNEGLLAHGMSPRMVSGGSTGLFDLDQGLTEIQLGSYVLMEGRYASVGLPFLPALFCAATVISKSRRYHAVLDCGWKALSGEFGLPVTPPGLEPIAFSDEHLICTLTEPESFDVGDVVVVMPAHLDPTVNLHERLLMFGDGTVTELPIDLRRSGPLLSEPIPVAGVG